MCPHNQQVAHHLHTARPGPNGQAIIGSHRKQETAHICIEGKCYWQREAAYVHHRQGKETSSISGKIRCSAWLLLPEQRKVMDDSEILAGMASCVGREAAAAETTHPVAPR